MDNVIALDIGRVCVHLRFDLCKEALGFSSDVEAPTFFMGASQKFEHGLCSVEHWLKVFHRVTANKFCDEQLIHAWNLIIGEEIDGMAELVRDITQLGYRFVFFSDTNEPHIMHVYRNMSFAHLVTGQIYSYEVGAQKPSDQMYDAFERTYGKPCFYVDDKPCNIDGAVKHGWRSQLFTSADKFREQFFREVVNA